MVIITVLKSLLDIKHLGNLSIGILIVFSLENLSDFPGSFHVKSFFSISQTSGILYVMRLWVLFKFYEEYYVLVFLLLLSRN